MNYVFVIALLILNPQDALNPQQERELSSMLEAVIAAKPGTQPLDLSKPSIKRQFELADKVEQYGMLKLNQSMVKKEYKQAVEFIGLYLEKYGPLFDSKMKNDWLLAYADSNSADRKYFDSELKETGLSKDDRKKAIVSYYHFAKRSDRKYYISIIARAYQNGKSDFSKLTKDEKAFVQSFQPLFP